MHIWRPDLSSSVAVPIFASAAQAGFPSPAEDYVEGQLDLNQHLIRRPAATFLVRVAGDSMTGAGIFPGDILIVDKSLAPLHGSIVVAVINGELTIKRLCKQGSLRRLEADNPKYGPIEIPDDMEVWCWGVVTAAIRQFGRR